MRLAEQLENLKAERRKIAELVAPLRAKRDALQAKFAPIENQMRELAKQIRETEGARAFELDQEIAVLQRGLGAATLNKVSPQ